MRTGAHNLTASSQKPPKRSSAQDYALALLATALAIVLRFALDPFLGTHLPYVTFFVAVAAVVWLSRSAGPALLTILLGALAAHYFFAFPRHSLRLPDAQQQFGLATYFMVAFAFFGFGRALHRSRTQAVRAERERKIEQSEFQAVIEQVRDYAIFTVDLEGRPTSWNEGVKRVFGFDQSEFLGHDITSTVFTPEDLAAGIPLAELNEAADTGQAGNDRWMRRKNGERFFAMGVTTAQRDSDGRLIGFTKVARDQTRRKRAEEAASRLAAIVESSADAIIGMDLLGTITTWNRSAEQLYGYMSSEAVGQPITIIIPPDRFEEEKQILERIRLGERIENFETVRVRKDGTQVDVALTISPVKDDRGVIFGASKIAHDIGDRKRAEAERLRLLESERHARNEAERASRLKDEFLATLSHELRNPLNAILGWARLIEKDPKNQKLLEEGIPLISKSAKVQADIISDLLDMSRIISGKIRLEIENVSLPELVQSSVDSIRHSADAKGIQIQVTISTVLESVCGDPNRLQQVLWNLLSNALKFTPKNGQIQVSVAKKESYAEIVVSDNGMGIKPEFLPFVFDRFRQADASTTRQHGGLGLGLAIVKNLVELHGGWVRAESGGEGKGSTFTVGLPIPLVRSPRTEQSPQSSDVDGLAISLNGVQVLAVDDEAATRDLVKRILEEHDAEVLVARSGEEALGILQRHHPHIVLSDIGMPGMDGYDFLRRLRQTGNQTPAVAVTAFARSEDRTKALVAGYHGHVTKPLEPTELVATVAAFAKTFPVRA